MMRVMDSLPPTETEDTEADEAEVFLPRNRAERRAQGVPHAGRWRFMGTYRSVVQRVYLGWTPR